MAFDPRAAASALLEARRAGQPIASLPVGSRPASVDEAYRIQDAVSLESPAIVGWKTGMSPVDRLISCAPIYQGDLLEAGCTLRRSGFHAPALEIEFGFRLDRAVDPRNLSSADADRIVAAATSFVPVIELVSSRFIDAEALTAFDRLADQNGNGRLIVGAPVTDWRPLDFHVQAVELEIDGSVVQRAMGSHPAGNPLPLVTWQIIHAAARGEPLRPGAVVTTGSLQGMTPLGGGHRVVGSWGNWGRVEISFDA